MPPPLAPTATGMWAQHGDVDVLESHSLDERHGLAGGLGHGAVQISLTHLFSLFESVRVQLLGTSS